MERLPAASSLPPAPPRLAHQSLELGLHPGVGSWPPSAAPAPAVPRAPFSPFLSARRTFWVPQPDSQAAPGAGALGSRQHPAMPLQHPALGWEQDRALPRSPVPPLQKAALVGAGSRRHPRAPCREQPRQRAGCSLYLQLINKGRRRQTGCIFTEVLSGENLQPLRMPGCRFCFHCPSSAAFWMERLKVLLEAFPLPGNSPRCILLWISLFRAFTFPAALSSS